MTPEAQTLLSLLAVAIAAVWLVRRAFRKNAASGCGGECACPTASPEVKKLRRHPRH